MARAVIQPLSAPVPADDAAYLHRKGCLKLAFRVAKRRMQLAGSGQQRWLRDAIDPRWKRLLWLHLEAPQVGDMLMDLAPRSLLADSGHTVDVYTTPMLAELLRGDRWVRQVLSTPSDIDADQYDAVITSSHAPRAWSAKRRHAAALPWVALAGDYTVPDYQRALFNTTRLADLLGVRMSPAARTTHARQKLAISPPRPAPWADHRQAVAIAVGGVWPGRTYAHWTDVIGALHGAGVSRVRLLGSHNGSALAADIVQRAPRDLHIDNGVGQFDLHATRSVLAGSRVALCADGGLMHLALTTDTPVVALFSADVAPAWRLPDDFEGVALQSATPHVSAIAPDRIAAEALRWLQPAP